MVRQPSILKLFWILIQIQVRIVLIHHNTLKIKQQYNEFTQNLSSQLQIESLQDQLWEKDSILKVISGEINERRDIKSNGESNRREKRSIDKMKKENLQYSEKIKRKTQSSI